MNDSRRGERGERREMSRVWGVQIWGRGLRVGMMLLGRCFSFFFARAKGMEWDGRGEREKGTRGEEKRKQNKEEI